jgi:hypothetical protein
MIYLVTSVLLQCSMQNDPVVSKASELLRLGLMPSVEEIKGGKVCIRVFFGDNSISHCFLLGFALDRHQFVEHSRKSCFVT